MPRHIQRFGSRSTTKKQDIVVGYLKSYVTALRKTGLHLSYVDGFCGAGWRIPAGIEARDHPDLFAAHETPKLEPSTALKALELRPAFDRYVFGDTKNTHLDALRAAVAEMRLHSPDTPEPEFIVADANELVRRECDLLRNDQRRRAVMFLDPFGMQVDWSTLEVIQRSGRVDLWLLLPSAIAVARLLPRSGPPSANWTLPLDRFFGTEKWRNNLLEAKPDLFGNIVPRRAVALSVIVEFLKERLGQLFGPGLHPIALELRIGKRPAYHLAFACSAPSARAREVALRIAGHLLDRARRDNQAGS